MSDEVETMSRIRDLLQCKGFEILLLYEYKTSSQCFVYKSQVKPFKARGTSRPWQDNDLRIWLMCY